MNLNVNKLQHLQPKSNGRELLCLFDKEFQFWSSTFNFFNIKCAYRNPLSLTIKPSDQLFSSNDFSLVQTVHFQGSIEGQFVLYSFDSIFKILDCCFQIHFRHFSTFFPFWKFHNFGSPWFLIFWNWIRNQHTRSNIHFQSH
jgi:hypothetical protein